MEVVFEPEESTKLVSILLPEDDVFPEANKTLEVYLSATPGVYINPFGYAYATILNDDEPLTGSLGLVCYWLLYYLLD